jgi:PAS domain S-box-containing protein
MREREYFDTLCNTGDGVFIVDSNKRIVRWNKGAEKILKYSEADVLDRECYSVIAGRALPDKVFCGQNCRLHGAAIKGTPHRNFDIISQTKDGEPLWLNLSIFSPVQGDDQFVAHLIRDVTREKKTSVALDQFLADLVSQSIMPKETAGEKQAKGPAGIKYQAPDKNAVTLSGREIEVLTLLAEGLPTKSLAQKLNISHFTARNHIQNILVKLDLHSKAQAVSYAFKKGIL